MLKKIFILVLILLTKELTCAEVTSSDEPTRTHESDLEIARQERFKQIASQKKIPKSSLDTFLKQMWQKAAQEDKRLERERLERERLEFEELTRLRLKK